MLKIIKERERKEEHYFTYDFEREDTSGYTFPCDRNGNIQKNKMNEYGIANYNYCISHPEDFIWQGVQEHESSYIEPAIGECICGEVFELWDQYQGACECPKCGQWYNLFGQSLINPEYWEEE